MPQLVDPELCRSYGQSWPRSHATHVPMMASRDPPPGSSCRPPTRSAATTAPLAMPPAGEPNFQSRPTVRAPQ